MRKMFAAMLAAFLCCTAASVAGTRVIVYPGQNPQSTQTNGAARFERLDKGTWRRDAFGTACATGAYSNLSVVPNGGMYVAVQPTTSGTYGSLYQMMADDTSQLPQGSSFSPVLAADTTQICVHGMQSGPSGSLGPITAPSGGQSQYYLVEAQLQQQDTNNQSVLFVNAQGGTSYQNLNTNRVDAIVYQLKAGTAGTSPTPPSIDTGWTGVANILVPGGASSITSGMISALAAFNGFLQNGANVTVQGLTVSSFTTPGCVQNTSAGVFQSLPCTSGLGSVLGTNPIVANTASGTATISCPTCVTSVNGSTYISSSGGTTPTLTLVGPISSTLLPTNTAYTNVNNNFSVTENFQGIVANSLTYPLQVSLGTASSNQMIVGVDSSGYGTFRAQNGNGFHWQNADGSSTYASVSGSGLTEGSSTYGPTSATVNGTASALAMTVSAGSGGQGYTTLSNNNAASPATAAGSFFGWNRSNGDGEADVYSLYNNSTTTARGVSFHAYVASTDMELGYIDRTGAYHSGSSTYGPTSATVNGLVSSTAGTSNNSFQWKCASGGTNCDLGENASASLNSISGSVLTINNGTNTSAGAYATMDTSGNFATAGGVWANGALWSLSNGGVRITAGLSTVAAGDMTLGLAGAAEGSPYVGCSGSAANCTLYFYTNGTGSTFTAKIDGSGTMTAANFIVSSRREWKKNIVPYRFDPLSLLGQIDYKEYDCRTAECGRTGIHKVGIIANDSPQQVSGKGHDHYDAFALAAIDGSAIVELHRQLLALLVVVCALLVWCVILTALLVLRRA